MFRYLWALDDSLAHLDSSALKLCFVIGLANCFNVTRLDVPAKCAIGCETSRLWITAEQVVSPRTPRPSCAAGCTTNSGQPRIAARCTISCGTFSLRLSQIVATACGADFSQVCDKIVRNMDIFGDIAHLMGNMTMLASLYLIALSNATSVEVQRCTKALQAWAAALHSEYGITS